jgi:hypothetical protein
VPARAALSEQLLGNEGTVSDVFESACRKRRTAGRLKFHVEGYSYRFRSSWKISICFTSPSIDLNHVFVNENIGT